MLGNSVIDHELGDIQGQNREYSRKMKIAIACIVCVAICAIAVYASIVQSAVSLMALWVVLASVAATTLVYVAYVKISARKVRHTEDLLSREEALSLLEHDVSKDKLKHVLRNASPDALEEVCKRVSEVSLDNISIITQVMEQIEDREEILELLDLADSNSSHIDESVRRRDFGRAALTRRLEVYVADLAASGNYQKIGAILEYDPSFIYSTRGPGAEGIIRIASDNMHTGCVQMLKEFHRGIVEGFIKGDDRYRKCDPMLSVQQVIPVDRECALDMYTKLAKSSCSMRSSDLFAIPEGLREDFEEVFLKYCVAGSVVKKTDPTAADKTKDESTAQYTATVGKVEESQLGRVTETYSTAPTSYGLDFLVDNQLDERNVMLALENNGSREVIEYIFSNTTDSAILEKACKRISRPEKRGGSSIIGKAIDSMRGNSPDIGDFLEVVFAGRDDRLKEVLSFGLATYVDKCARARRYRNAAAVIEHCPSCIYGNSLDIMGLAYANGIERYGKILKDLHQQIIVGTRNGDPRYKKCNPILSIVYIARIDRGEASNLLRGLLKSGYTLSKSDMRTINSLPGDAGYALRKVVSESEEQEVMGDVLFPSPSEQVLPIFNGNKEVIEYILSNTANGAAAVGVCAKMWDPIYDPAFIVGEVINSMRDQVEAENFLSLIFKQPGANSKIIGFNRKFRAQMVRWIELDSYFKIDSVLKFIPSAIYASVEGDLYRDLTQLAVEKGKLDCVSMLKEFHKEIVYGIARGDSKYSDCSLSASIASISKISIEEACTLLSGVIQSSSYVVSEPYKELILKDAPHNARQALKEVLYAPEQDIDTLKSSKAWGISTYVEKVQSSIGKVIPNVSYAVSRVVGTGSILYEIGGIIYRIGAFVSNRLTNRAVDAVKSHPTVVSAYDSKKAAQGTILVNNGSESNSIEEIKGMRGFLGRDFSSKEALDLLTKAGSGVTANVVLCALLNTSREEAKEVCSKIFDKGENGIIATIAIVNTLNPKEVENLLEVVFDIVDNDLVKEQISQVLSKHLFDSLRKGGYRKVNGMLKYNPLYLYETEGGKDLIETALDVGRRHDAHILKELHREVVYGYIEGRDKYRDSSYSVLSSIVYASKISVVEALEMLGALIKSGYEITANLKQWLRENFPENAHAALDAVFEKKAEEMEKKSTVASSSDALASSEASSSVVATCITNSVDTGKLSGVSSDTTEDKVDLQSSETIDASAEGAEGSDISSDEGPSSSVSTQVDTSSSDKQRRKSARRDSSMASSVTAMWESDRNSADKVR